MCEVLMTIAEDNRLLCGLPGVIVLSVALAVLLRYYIGMRG